jgi:hypothetical protein
MWLHGGCCDRKAGSVLCWVNRHRSWRKHPWHGAIGTVGRHARRGEVAEILGLLYGDDRG